MTWTLRYSDSVFVLRCCFTSWNGRCCEFPLDHEADEPESSNYYSNWFSPFGISNWISTTTEEPSNIFDVYRERMMRGRDIPIEYRLPIEYRNAKPKQWWAEFK